MSDMIKKISDFLVFLIGPIVVIFGLLMLKDGDVTNGLLTIISGLLSLSIYLLFWLVFGLHLTRAEICKINQMPNQKDGGNV